MLAKDYRTEVRTTMGRQSRLVLFYCLVFTTAGYAGAFALVAAGFLSPDALSDDHVGELSIAGVAAGMLFVLLKLRGRFLPSLRRPEPVSHRMGIRMLGSCLLLLLGAQAAFSVITLAVDAVANALGYSVFGTADALDAAAPSIWLILYTGAIAPVTEEVLFRGIVMGSLARFGQTFAIVASALLFGLFHSDFAQGGFAFFMGLVLGFVAMRYSLGWAIALHAFNNLVVSDWMGRLVEMLPSLGQEVFTEAFFIAGVVGAAYVLLRNRSAIKRFLVEHRAEPGTAAAAFTTPSFLVLAALQLALCFLAFAPQ